MDRSLHNGATLSLVCQSPQSGWPANACSHPYMPRHYASQLPASKGLHLSQPYIIPDSSWPPGRSPSDVWDTVHTTASNAYEGTQRGNAEAIDDRMREQSTSGRRGALERMQDMQSGAFGSAWQNFWGRVVSSACERPSCPACEALIMVQVPVSQQKPCVHTGSMGRPSVGAAVAAMPSRARV